jgi:O-antigen/teichoic acid export membrane protein
VLWISIVAAATNLVLNFLLVPIYGPLGAAIATSSTLIVHNVLKQWGLRRGTGISLFERRTAIVYVSIAVAAGGLLALHSFVALSLWVGLLFAGAASCVVLLVSRSTLRAGETFPELARIPLIRRFVLGR